MSQLGIILQESIHRETKTILALLREQMDMDGVDGIRRTRRRTLKERLGLKSIGCCGGATWGFRPTTINVSENEDEEQNQEQQEQDYQAPNQPPLIDAVQVRSESSQVPGCNGRPLTHGGMNLAAALAAERHFRAVEGTNVTNAVGHPSNDNSNVDLTVTGTGTAPGTPIRVSLMRLLAETDSCDGEEKAGGGEAGNDSMCCVCMGRKKGAAFIPCGHTFCRVCSREVWLNRGSCPLCNRSIREILDIF